VKKLSGSQSQYLAEVKAMMKTRPGVKIDTQDTLSNKFK